ncbi:prepilin peptidase [Corynebacterium sp. p3-SID1145]|uniref:prepilin peptidase n=1 Tax=unclassified Corynebacterium TaxID=2624378 RepID=UPI0021A9FE72|nr:MULTISPECIES: prepilin peptidase [unclassified Corynebacterium]MCT1452345.1 prepilin peptidase [Corynebacterium sp. p3-SID1145]MCT1461259.1 prepilin peptidase [Corynebacterium sp. p3-SID1140]
MGEISVGAVAVSSVLCAAAAIWTVALIAVDAEELRLPDVWTLPVAGAAAAACVAVPAGAAGLVWPLAYAVAGRGIGGGDVKLAVPLGVVLALLGGVGAVLAGMFLASMFTVLVLLARRKKTMAHGPSMLAAAWLVGIASTFLSPV